jgi:hypothetical protein
MKWDWMPGARCGEFELGAPLKSKTYSEPLVLLEPAYDEADWSTYKVGDEEARLRVEDGIVVGVECVRSLLLNGREIIGAREADLDELLGYAPSIKDRTDCDARAEVPELGLALWLERGVVESATVDLM